MVSKSSNPGEGTSAPGSQGPVGKGKYVVKRGDCIESVAFSHGHFWETIWNDSNNQQLRSARNSPNVLLAGDMVFVPEIRPKEETGATEQRHRFRRRGVPSCFQIRLLREDQPRAGERFVLNLDGQLHSGTTDDDGRLKVPIPPNAQRAELRVGEGSNAETFRFQLGGLDPVSEITGVQQRLRSLGFYHGPAGDDARDETAQALRAFQAAKGLDATGQADEATRQKLVEAHGS